MTDTRNKNAGLLSSREKGPFLVLSSAASAARWLQEIKQCTFHLSFGFVHVSRCRSDASSRARVVEGQRGEGRWVQVTHDLVQAGDLLLQQVVLLLGDLLPLLRDLQALQQLSVLHVQVVDQQVCFAVLMPLGESKNRDGHYGVQ